MGYLGGFMDFYYFRNAVMSGYRYIWDERIESFLEEVSAACHRHVQEFSVGTEFFRAQIGYNVEHLDVAPYKICKPYSAQRMMPLRDRSREGRVNPAGIPCLYVATTEEAALSEMRPWGDTILSLATLRLRSSMRVVSFAHPVDFSLIPPEDGNSQLRELEIWAYLNSDFSRPVTRSDDTQHYATTQIISEVIRRAGFDGVMYRSRFTNCGDNLALFNIESCEIDNIQLRSVKAVKYDFEDPEYDNPYRIWND